MKNNYINTNIFKFTSSGSPGLALWKLSNTWQSKIKNVLKPFSLTHVQFVVLANIAYLNKNDIVATATLVSQKADIDKMMTSEVVQKLIHKNLVQKIENIIDKRSHYLTLTKEGTKTIISTLPLVEETDIKFFKQNKSEIEKMII